MEVVVKGGFFQVQRSVFVDKLLSDSVWQIIMGLCYSAHLCQYVTLHLCDTIANKFMYIVDKQILNIV